MINQFPPQTIELMDKANESELRVVCLPLSSHFKDRAADFTAPDLPDGWDINTSFIQNRLKKIAGDGLVLRYTSQPPYSIGLRASSGNPYFRVSASLDRKNGTAVIHQTLGAEIHQSPNHFYEAYANLINMFSALGFTTIETETSGSSMAHMIRAGFQIVPADRQDIHDSISRALIKYTSPRSSHEIEFKRNGIGDLEDTLIEWSRDIDLFGDETAQKLLADSTGRIWFDATNIYHAKQFQTLTDMLVKPHAPDSEKKDIGLSLVP